MQICFLRVALALTTLAGLVTPADAGFVTFGTSGNQFTMEFVAIGNPGNTADNTGAPNPAGSVGYTYGIGKFEVSENMITKYNANFGTANNLQITTDNRGVKKPATSVSWNQAARFINWLNTSTSNFAAYKFNPTDIDVNDNIVLWDETNDPDDYDQSNPYRSKRATYVLPSYNEWYKAAYYDPMSEVYYDYATGSDSAPTMVDFGEDQGTAVFTLVDDNYVILSQPGGPADVNLAGGLSPYGVMGLGGNVYELEESSYDLSNSSSDSMRGIRGGAWKYGGYDLSSSWRMQANTYMQFDFAGFRVVSLAPSGPPAVPEPSMMVIGMLFGLGGLMAKRRMKK